MVELITPAEFARRQGVTPQAVHRAIGCGMKRSRQQGHYLMGAIVSAVAECILRKHRSASHDPRRTRQRQGPVAEFATITEARRWAESFGTTADQCAIRRGGREVALHVRDTSGDGTHWFKATI